MNHELRGDTATQAAQGIDRRHGQNGAFVSDYVINRNTLAVQSGSDPIGPNLGGPDGVTYYDYPSGTFGMTPVLGGHDSGFRHHPGGGPIPARPDPGATQVARRAIWE